MAKFKVGDRVRNLEEIGDIPHKMKGTVLEISSVPYVEWDEEIGGHDAGGLGRAGYCHSQQEDLLELVEPKSKAQTNQQIELCKEILRSLPHSSAHLREVASNILIRAIQGEENE